MTIIQFSSKSSSLFLIKKRTFIFLALGSYLSSVDTITESFSDWSKNITCLNTFFFFFFFFFFFHYFSSSFLLFARKILFFYQLYLFKFSLNSLYYNIFFPSHLKFSLIKKIISFTRQAFSLPFFPNFFRAKFNMNHIWKKTLPKSLLPFSSFLSSSWISKKDKTKIKPL